MFGAGTTWNETGVQLLAPATPLAPPVPPKLELAPPELLAVPPTPAVLVESLLVVPPQPAIAQHANNAPKNRLSIRRVYTPPPPRAIALNSTLIWLMSRCQEAG